MKHVHNFVFSTFLDIQGYSESQINKYQWKKKGL